MTIERMLQFILMVIFQLSFGLIRGSTYSILSSGQAEKIKNYIASIDHTFPGESTASLRMRQVLEVCHSEIYKLVEQFQDYFYTSVGNMARNSFRSVYESTKISITPPPECFIGFILPSELFHEINIEERGRIIPFLNAKMLWLSQRMTSIGELIGQLKCHTFDGGVMKFSLASKLGFFNGTPGKHEFYRKFKKIERLSGSNNDIINKVLGDLRVSDLTVVSADTTNVPVDERDMTGSTGTGSRGTFFGHKAAIAVDVNCIPISKDFNSGRTADSTMFTDTILPVKKMAKETRQEIWCIPADAGFSNPSVIEQIENLNAVPFVDINPKNSELLKNLKEKATVLKKYSRKAWKAMPKEEKNKWRENIREISETSSVPIPIKKKRIF